MNNALITGGAGFLGLNIARTLLDHGFRVVLVDNFSRKSKDLEILAVLKHPKCDLLELDLTEDKNLSSIGDGFTHVIHLASIVGVRNVEANPENVVHSNVKMMKNMIQLSRNQKNLQRFLYASTSEVYAGALENFNLEIPTPESSPLALSDLKSTRTSYMLSKILGEHLCHLSGLPMTIIRPHNIYGPRMGLSHVIPEQLKSGYFSPPQSEVLAQSIHHTRTFCFIDDAVDMIYRILQSPACEGKTLNVGSTGPEIAIGDVVQICLDVVGKNQRVQAGEDNPGSPARRRPDVSQTTNLIGKLNNTPLKEGIGETYKWYVRNEFSQSQKWIEPSMRGPN
jgi:nucleoside-diphosphate-sugar epimerase